MGVARVRSALCPVLSSTSLTRVTKTGSLRSGGPLRAIPLFLLLCACSDTRVVSTVDPNQALALLRVEPLLLDFGGVPVGTTESKEVTLFNDGDARLEITSLQVSGSLAFAFAEAPTAFSLVPGASETVTVDYTAIDVEDSGQLAITANQQEGAAEVVDLVGEAQFARLTVSNLHFPTNLRDCPEQTATVDIESSGDAPATIEQVVLTSAGPVAMVDELALPMRLMPGQRERVTFVLPSDQIVDLHGSIQVVSDAVGSPSAAPVTGEVVGNIESVVEIFDQNTLEDDPSIDLLLVVDRSGSMINDAVALTNAIDTLTAMLLESQLDFQVAVIASAHGCYSGSLLTADTLTTDSLRAAIYSSNDPRTERGLAMTEAALSQVGSCNEGMIRAGSGVQAIWVSDEAEQSPLPWRTHVNNILAMSPEFVGHAVVGVSSDPGWDGADYRSAAEATGGISVRLGFNWDNIFDEIGPAIVASSGGLQSSWALANQPTPGTVTVMVNREVVTEGWEVVGSYLVFEEPPPAGSEISVEYLPVGAC
ncbi:MAG: choice-of-anchor D domain-containing protein [Proteobacteria bacterium]|nr:choice-of-anchor D domain-containing protein [Pseudomonadota bacterium]